MNTTNDKKESVSQLDILNKFLIEIANADKIGIRRKLVLIKRFISALPQLEIKDKKPIDEYIKEANELMDAIRRKEYEPYLKVEHQSGMSTVKLVDKKTGKTWEELKKEK